MAMTQLNKHRLQSFLKWVSLDFTGSNLRSSRTTLCATGFHIVQSLRFYRSKKVVRKEAQAALLEYLHSTRSLQFMDAEHISQNSPIFLEKLVKMVKNDTEIGRPITRFLRYQPINEYEPFFESMGLKPSEYSTLLPRDLFFLNDDVMLLQNYHVLCNLGINRTNIGRIYKEATEAFKSDCGVLKSKLQAFEEMGMDQSTIIKFVTSSPYLLIGDNSRELCKVLDKLKKTGIEYGWIEGHLSEGTYNFTHLHELLSLLTDMGCSEEQLGKLICQNPQLLFEASGNATLSLIGFLLKFGSTKSEICSMFLRFPQIQVRKFVCNLRQSYQFLVEIEMEVLEIGRIVRSVPMLLGSCHLKKLQSLLACLNTGKKRLRDIVRENPQTLKDWVIGSKVTPLPNTGEELQSKMMKTKFLLDLGFVENSNEMRKALKVFRGKGGELKERFDCFVNAGLKRKDVSHMVKVAPQVLNQSKDVIETKIDFLVNGLGYPLSTLIVFPAFLGYTIQRVKIRFAMYDWLKDQNSVQPKLSLSSILACSDQVFIKRYVNQHPQGPIIWQKLMKTD
ncbi:transcription termination factor MTEF18, mitochondrial-like [Actinidia eriantha]|uniref:transcription termination factor MTEF18, mitochondrial-like n=1 Tax=Actinidia eriantha TaxID=165200 RepID=UPI00258C0933|nr:transcription termination factor MTEF18, mitochondrial-like [Actinidia eriantha]